VLLYVAALLCKAAALPLPIVFLILDVFPSRRFSHAAGHRWRSILGALLEKTPLAVAGLFFLLVAASARYAGDPLNTAKGGGMASRLLQTGYAVFHYVEKTIWPANLSGLYERPDGSWSRPLLAIGTFVGISLTLAALWFGRRWPGFLAAWLAYLAMLAPVCGLVPSASGLVADRYAYLPTIPLFVLIAYVLARLSRIDWRGGRLGLPNATWMMAAVVAVALASQSFRLCATWRNSEAVLARALESGGISRARYFTGLAVVREQAGRLAEAEAAYREALATSPAAPDAAAGLGLLLAVRGQHEQGLAWLDRAVDMDPNHFVGYCQKGLVLAEQGKLEEAARQLETALRIHPYYVDARLNLARVRQDQGRTAEAAEHYARVLAIDPGNRPATQGLAAAIAQLNQGRGQPGDAFLKRFAPSSTQRKPATIGK
jgi:Tfp pilus assembly protein PilF